MVCFVPPLSLAAAPCGGVFVLSMACCNVNLVCHDLVKLWYIFESVGDHDMASMLFYRAK
jgi:hypothetical protein